ncbi:MAG: tetratricopeptide repeat protein [Geothermobacteraceae bacterium]
MNVVVRNTILALLVLTLPVGCGTHRARQEFMQAEKLVRQEQYVQAVALYTRAVADNPDSLEYRMRLMEARGRAARQVLNQARQARSQGLLQQAVEAYRQAQAFDPTLEQAAQERKQVENRIRAEELTRQAEEFFRTRRYSQAMANLEQALLLAPGLEMAEELRDKVRSVVMTEVDGVDLDVASSEPISLKFKSAKIKEVFKILSRLSGITFIFDEDVERETVSINLERASFSQALELILKMKKLGMRVLNPKTVILYPATNDKEKQYQDQLIQTFYLSNIEAKKAVNMLRTMLQLRKIYVHEELNALVIRDKPEVVRLAEQILRAADRADSEVLFELELIEVSHDDTLKLGASLDNTSFQFGLDDGNGTILSGAAVSSLSNRKFLYTVPSATFDFQKTLGDSEILASPHIRLKNGAKAKVHVGSREPVVTTTTTGDNVSSNVQYVDVGVKLDLEAHVRLDATVQTKVQLEVSNRGADVPGLQNVTAFPINTTTAQTELVLKDGERTILGGLIRDDLTKGSDRLPLIGRIPLIGDLLAKHNRTKKKREILLSITPHIVKDRELPAADVASIWSGPEDQLQFGPSFQSFARDFDALQNLPRPSGTLVAPDEEAEASVPAASTQMAAVEQAGESQPKPPSVPPAVVDQTAPAPAPTPTEASQPPAEEPTPPVIEQPVQEELPPPVPVEMPPLVAKVFVEGPELVDVGSEFDVAVRVAEINDLFSAPVFITYNPQVLEFSSASEGGFLQQNARNTVFTSSPLGGIGGRVIIGYKQGAGGTGASGDGILYNLRFKALAPGRTIINLERINFRDPRGERLRVTGEGLQVEVR